MIKKLFAEFFGTFWLVFGGCGTALYACGLPDVGVGYVGVSMAFGLTVLTMAYAVGHISGGHFNPAVTIGLACGGRFKWSEVAQYIVSQLIGGIAAAACLYIIFKETSTVGFASNGYGEHSPEHYSFMACALTEVLLTAFFLIIIHGATDKRAPVGFAPIAIGLGLTLIHLISIPVTNTSVNPARSLAVALFADEWALSQVWFFFVFPIIGGILGGVIYRFLLETKD